MTPAIWVLWSVIGFLAFAVVTAATGGNVPPLLGAALAVLCGPGTWLIMACVVIKGAWMLFCDPKPMAKIELEREQALDLLGEILADNDDLNGGTSLHSKYERAAREMLAKGGRCSPFPPNPTGRR